MKETRAVEYRLDKVLGLLERYGGGEFSYRESFDPGGDEIDQIIRRLNDLGERIQQSGQLISDYERRVTGIMNVLLRYTMFDFSDKANLSEAGDELDAIALALNTLGEELRLRIENESRHTARLEQVAVVMETTADAVIALDTEGRITQWNKSAERIYGYTKNEATGRNVFDLLGNDGNREQMMALFDRARGGEQLLNHEETRRNRSGETMVLLLTITPIWTGPVVTSISVVARDVTPQKRTEHELRRSEQRFRSLVEGVKDYAIMMLDAAGMVISWNEGARSLHGYEEYEARGQHYSLFFTEADRKEHLPSNMLKEAIRNGKSTRDILTSRKDGSQIWANLLVTCLTENTGQVSGFSLITRDLTEAKRKDDKIRQYTRTLEVKNVELEKINKELSSFTYISSHDLQEPLRKIRTFTSRLMQTDLNNLSEGGKDYCRRLEASAARMQTLIRDIISYTSLSTDKSSCIECDLAELIDKVARHHDEQLKKRSGRIEIGRICRTEVIPEQFMQLIGHLVSNSIKFASEKRPLVISIKSTIIEHPPQPAPVEQLQGPYCEITVRDNGIGFEPRFNQQVFEVFQKLHGHDKYPGTGIGLAICKKIVENHHGFIRAQGELGKGTTITLLFPVSAKPAAES